MSAYLGMSPDEQRDEDDAREERQTAMERSIAAQLVKPGSRVDALLLDNTDGEEWHADLRGVIRMAADPFSDPLTLAATVRTMVYAAIGRAAEEAIRSPHVVAA